VVRDNGRGIVTMKHSKPGIAAGAKGYLLKNGDMDELYSAIRKVNAGEVMISSDLDG
jgi:DNA-binding NarL/FixJ family response regulator